jgi:hypothetical protein
MSEHDPIREALLEGEITPEMRAHIETCEACRELERSLGDLDVYMTSLPALHAPADLVERTIERAVREGDLARPEPSATEAIFAIVRGLALGLAWLAKLVVSPLRSRKVRWGLAIATPVAFAMSFVAIFPMADRVPPATDEERVSENAEDDDLDTVLLDGTRDRELGGDALGDLRGGAESQLEDGLFEVRPQTRGIRERGAEDDEDEGETHYWRDEAGDDGFFETTIATERVTSGWEANAPRETTIANGTTEDGRFAQGNGQRSPGGETARTREQAVDPGELAGQRGEPATGDPQTITIDVPRDLEQTRAPSFLPERDRIDALSFREARGYWASTYVPGDPAQVVLRRRLASFPAALALAERAEVSDLALDPPRSGAMALRVATDRASIEGSSRVLLQVGLRGARASAGRRPTLHTEVVIDARAPLDADAQARLRALLGALGRSREGADRIGVIAAGEHGGELVALGTMRFGEMSVALRRLEQATGGAPTSLDQAVRSAIAAVGREGDAGSPLGTALVLVVTPSLDAADAALLEPIAHAGAIGGVTTSAIALGDTVDLDATERVALAGHGRRRSLASAPEAEQLIADEVRAASRVVARALRLRIRLAPGVQLVDVIGSRRLDERESERAVRAERAVDRTLAHDLGIAVDRHEDEDGIQILIPAFYADDEHAILLDLVAPGPGPVADVSLRYKDLLRLENASANERASIERGPTRRGPRARGVLAQLLAHELSASFRAAARALEAGQTDGARLILARVRARLDGVRAEVPELAGDRALARDGELSAAYEAALVSGAELAPLADSLRYAGRRRLHSDPLAGP